MGLELLPQVITSRPRKSWVEVGGKNKSDVSKQIDQEFFSRGWEEKQFSTSLEIEWNNKDPFYDRDLNNFRLLFDLRVVSVGVIITRTDELQQIFDDLGRGKSFGNSTTHLSKLLPKVNGGGGGGCPLLVFGISKKLFLEDA